MVILDTNIIIDHLRLWSKKRSALDEINEKISTNNLALSIVSIQELFTGKSTKEVVIEERILKLASSLKVLSYTQEISKLAGEILRDIAPDIGFADAAIAATAILNKAKLFTLNKKDFQDIKGLKLI